MAKRVSTSKFDSDYEIGNLIKLVVIVSLIVLVFYLITIFVNKKEDKKEETTKTPETIQYDNILVGNILTQPNTSYYVLAKVSDDVNNKVYDAYISNYKGMTDAIRIYYVLLDNPLNSKYYSDNSNFNINKITDISFKEPTLLLIENKKIKRSYEGNDEILRKLKQISNANN